jgi:hypothetical protein
VTFWPDDRDHWETCEYSNCEQGIFSLPSMIFASLADSVGRALTERKSPGQRS